MKAFEYKGKVERLQKEVEEFGDKLNQRYKEILGEERYGKLAKQVNKVLVDEAFFDSVENLNKYFGQKILREGHPSVHLFPHICGGKLSNKGRIKDKEIK